MSAPRQQRASIRAWAIVGALMFMTLQIINPVPWASDTRTIAIGLIAHAIGGAIIGGFAAGIRNWLVK